MFAPTVDYSVRDRVCPPASLQHSGEVLMNPREAACTVATTTIGVRAWRSRAPKR